jgi:xanthine dehydrogenase accessory factor
MKRETLEQLLADRAAKRTVVLATNLASGEERLIYPLEDDAEGDVDATLLEAARKTVRSDRSASVEGEDGETFLHVFNPPLRLLIVGAVHIAQPLSQMAAIAGYDVVVIDPRRAFATDARFPGVELVPEWPDEGLEALALDHRTAVVTLTHDPKLDDPALTVALKSEVFYIGSLGSNKTHAARLERLRREGIEEEALGRINGPIGLHIGAKSPAEIALAIMAQVTAALRQPT